MSDNHLDIIQELQTHQQELETKNEELLRIQQELTETQQRYQELYDLAPVGYFTFNRRGQIMEVNLAGAIMLGYTRPDLHGKPFTAYLQSHDIPIFLNHLQKVLVEQLEAQCELEVQSAAKGNSYNVQIKSSPIVDWNDMVSGLRTMVVDITARKATEHILKQYQQIISTMPDLVSLVDREYRYQIVNDTYCHAYQKTAAEIKRLTIPDLMGEGIFLKTVKPMIDRCFKGEYVTYEEWFNYPQYGSRYRRVSHAPCFSEQGQIETVATTVHDLTDLKQAQQASYFLASIVASSEDAIIGKTITGNIISWNEGATRIYGYTDKEALGQHISMLFPNKRIKQEMKRFQQVQQGKRLTRYETQRLRRDGQLIDISLTVSPIFDAHKQVIGVASIAHDITQRKQDQNQITQTNQQLTQAYDDTLKGWAHALGLRDAETGGHSERVVNLTTLLAQKLNFPESEIVHLRRGALLHDIGKMGIPDHILQKPGPLTSAERKIMQQHPIYAYHMLKSIKYLEPAIAIPLCHHERWDGNGYPYNLHSLEIPLMARIFSVVDVWDALTSVRVYRRAWEPAQALDYIRQQSKRSFDPQVVTAFLMMMTTM